MVFKNLCFLVHWTKVTSASEGLFFLEVTIFSVTHTMSSPLLRVFQSSPKMSGSRTSTLAHLFTNPASLNNRQNLKGVARSMYLKSNRITENIALEDVATSK